MGGCGVGSGYRHGCGSPAGNHRYCMVISTKQPHDHKCYYCFYKTVPLPTNEALRRQILFFTVEFLILVIQPPPPKQFQTCVPFPGNAGVAGPSSKQL